MADQLPKVKGVADIVFLLDATGSMQSCINSVKRNIAKFVQSLTEPTVNGASVVKDWRARVVGYRDCGEDNDHYEPAPFVNSVAELETQLSKLHAHGGGDAPESLLEALYKLAAPATVADQIDGNGWRPIGAARRFVVVFTDAPFHEPLAEPAGATIDDVINNLMTAKIILHIFAPKHCTRYNTLAEVDKSQWHAIGSEGLAAYTADPSKFGKIVEQLAKTITIEAAVPVLSVEF